MAHPNEDLVREAFAAFGRGDMDYLQKFFADDVRYHVAGRNPLSGDYQGPDQAVRVLTGVGERSGGTFGFELLDVLASDQHVVAIGAVSGERPGKQRLDGRLVQIYQFRDGKACEVWTYTYDQYAADEFWS